VSSGDTGNRADAVKNDLASSPILAEMTCLRLSEEQDSLSFSAQGTKPAHDGQKENSPLQPAFPSNIYTAIRPVENVIRAVPYSIASHRESQLARSNKAAAPCPPPMPCDDAVKRAFGGAISCDGATMREPVIPNG